MGGEWDDSLQSKEQIEASLLSKQEAAIRRERALAYAFTHQVPGIFTESLLNDLSPYYFLPSICIHIDKL